MSWAHIPELINPVAFTVGPMAVRWYGLMYGAAFLTCSALISRRLRTESFPFTKEQASDFFFWAVVGVLVGGRLGYVLLYDFVSFLADPLGVFLPLVRTESGLQFIGIYGMSYHGGLVGVVAAGILFCRQARLSFWQLADLVAPAVPLGYFWGRIGNFLNGELYGRLTNVPWAMVFPQDPLQRLRHPSQLYEALGEGLLLFALLWPLRRFRPFPGFSLCAYVCGYGLIRFFIEFTREPDAQIGLIGGWLTQGQILCLAMIVISLSILPFGLSRISSSSSKGE
ncbi:MAG: prolipoprotein diacylglyceryl transferase [Candidatus Omnitrophica bacterium]|nr:prolipoprotein diacylglyceryl transferase [Candidatus Omnitrophota bacterium]